MGCTFDFVSIKVRRGEQAQRFISAFAGMLECSGYLYEDVDLSSAAELFVEDEEGFRFELDAEPLFKMYEEGAQVLEILKDAISEAPEIELTAEYLCTFNDCGDALFVTYGYEGGKLTVVEKYSPVGEYLEYCEGCGADFEAVCNIADFDPANSYECPECGESLAYEMSIEQIEYTLSDGEWTETQHAGLVIGNGGWDGDESEFEEYSEGFEEFEDEEGGLPF